MRPSDLLAAPCARRFDRRVVLWLSFGYPLLYALGYLSKSPAGAAAIWPAHALTFAAFMLLPIRLWPLVGLGVLSWELLSRPLLFWVTSQSQPALVDTFGYAFANILTAAVPAVLARLMRLFRARDGFAVVVSPLWIVALFAGSLPGALLGAATRAHEAGIAFVPADMGLWVLAAVLTIVTFGPMVFGLILGFAEPART